MYCLYGISRLLAKSFKTKIFFFDELSPKIFINSLLTMAILHINCTWFTSRFAFRFLIHFHSMNFRYMKAQECVASRAQLSKEQKLIPSLIFHVESLEANLIKISAISKLDLMRNFKRSAARDFKINFAAVTHKLQEEPVAAEVEGGTKRKRGKGKQVDGDDDDDDAKSKEPVSKAKRGRKKAVADVADASGR